MMMCLTDNIHKEQLTVKTCATALIECDDESKRGWSAIWMATKHSQFRMHSPEQSWMAEMQNDTMRHAENHGSHSSSLREVSLAVFLKCLSSSSSSALARHEST
jgi:hypothetical protein